MWRPVCASGERAQVLGEDGYDGYSLKGLGVYAGLANCLANRASLHVPVLLHLARSLVRKHPRNGTRLARTCVVAQEGAASPDRAYRISARCCIFLDLPIMGYPPDK
jgi:hypothetical protein